MTRPTLILGGTGYVAGELLRLLAGHPSFEVKAVVSRSQAGQPIEGSFPHLSGSYPGAVFRDQDAARELLQSGGPLAVFSALPHAESAAMLTEAIETARASGTELALVDLSADFRHPDADLWAKVYGEPHAAPQTISSFTCGLPELTEGLPRPHIAHPGCFTTATVLGATPLIAMGLALPEVFVSAVTGSTGSGRSPSLTTHHPERQSNLFAYKPLGHRHEPEMSRLIREASKRDVRVDFVPHSGPFARGIHATIALRAKGSPSQAELRSAMESFYADSAFIDVIEGTPRLKDVVGSNRCRLGVQARGDRIVVFSVIDNLIKGAAGGAVQWMNRLCDLEETTGLTQPALGWL
ncbi:MAG: N-acetyl-gamma-glutamyl-phosphate reductase [Planctomycetota bacterium]